MSDSERFLATLHRSKNVKQSLQALYNTGKTPDELSSIIEESAAVVPSLKGLGSKFEGYKMTKRQLHKKGINKVGLQNIQSNDELVANIVNHRRRLNMIDDVSTLQSEPEQKKRKTGEPSDAELEREAFLVAPAARTMRRAYDTVTHAVQGEEPLIPIEGIEKKQETPKKKLNLGLKVKPVEPPPPVTGANELNAPVLGVVDANEAMVAPPAGEVDIPKEVIPERSGMERVMDAAINTASSIGLSALIGKPVDQELVKKAVLKNSVPTNVGIAHTIGVATNQPTPNMVVGMAAVGMSEISKAGGFQMMSDYAKSMFTTPTEDNSKIPQAAATPAPAPADAMHPASKSGGNTRRRPHVWGTGGALPPRFGMVRPLPEGVANQFAFDTLPAGNQRVSPVVQQILFPVGSPPMGLPGPRGQPVNGNLVQQAYANYLQDVSVPCAIR